MLLEGGEIKVHWSLTFVVVLTSANVCELEHGKHLNDIRKFHVPRSTYTRRMQTQRASLSIFVSHHHQADLINCLYPIAFLVAGNELKEFSNLWYRKFIMRNFQHQYSRLKFLQFSNYLLLLTFSQSHVSRCSVKRKKLKKIRNI